MCLVQSQNLNENLCPVPSYLNILFSAISENVKMTIELNLMSRGYSEQFDELKFQHLQMAPLTKQARGHSSLRSILPHLKCQRSNKGRISLNPNFHSTMPSSSGSSLNSYPVNSCEV